MSSPPPHPPPCACPTTPRQRIAVSKTMSDRTWDSSQPAHPSRIDRSNTLHGDDMRPLRWRLHLAAAVVVDFLDDALHQTCVPSGTSSTLGS